jgi:hypothetical protein
MTLEPQSALKVKLFGTLASQCHPKIQAEQKLHQINLQYFIQTAIFRTAQVHADLATNSSAGWVGKSNYEDLRCKCPPLRLAIIRRSRLQCSILATVQDLNGIEKSVLSP